MFPLPSIRMPLPPNLLMASARTVLPPAVEERESPAVEPPAFVPFNSMTGEARYPPCVLPSITTGSIICGRGESRGIVRTPPPGILNEMVSVKPAWLLALMICWRSDPGPLSFVFVTIKVNGTGVGVDVSVVTGGVLLPVFEETEPTVIVTSEVTAGHAGDSIGQNGWIPFFPGSALGSKTSLSHALSVSLMCSPGATSIVAFVGDGLRTSGKEPGTRSAAVSETLNRTWLCAASLGTQPT